MRRQFARAGMTAALLLGTVPLAGCGSYTKHDFIASADAICASAVRQTRSVAPPGTQQPAAVAGYLSHVLPILRTEEKQIRALKHPSESARDGAALTAYLRALASSVVAFEQLAAAAKTGDRQGIASAEAALRVNPVASLAASYGLRSCGAPGATVT